MLDPGSLGTLLIGLESARLDQAETAVSRRRRRPAGERRPAPIRLALARRLHAVAHRLAGPRDVLERRGEPAR